MVTIIQNLFDYKLNKLHELVDEYKWDGKNNLGMDSHTKLHKKFYKKLDDGWDQLKEIYDNFAKEVLLPYLGLNEALLQIYPNFRTLLDLYIYIYNTLVYLTLTTIRYSQMIRL